jgi:hypothetical protein
VYPRGKWVYQSIEEQQKEKIQHYRNLHAQTTLHQKRQRMAMAGGTPLGNQSDRLMMSGQHSIDSNNQQSMFGFSTQLMS